MTATWPDGRKAAVLVTVNLDGERALLAQDSTLVGREKTLSTPRYGLRRGVDTLLGVLEEYATPASWFAPGALVRTHPEVAVRVAAAHEIGLRGDDVTSIHDIPARARRDALDRAMASFAAIGVVPTGFRLPRGEWPQGLVDDLLVRGITWSSSFVADDLPFLLPGATGHDLVEIPFHYGAEDRQAFDWNFSPAIPAGHARIASYGEVLENWMWEFEGAVSEEAMFVLTLTPHIIATPGRIGLLRELLRRMHEIEGVWFAQGSTIAEWWRRQGPDRGSGHPAAVFLRESGWDSF